MRPVLAAAATLFLSVTATAALAAALTFPHLSGRVVDDAHIISGGTAQTLTAALAAHEQKTGDQIVVVTLSSLQGVAIEDFGYRLGRAWGIGQKGKDNGALLIVAPNERKARIEVGYGLEGTLTDAQSAQIIQGDMLPHFRTGDYDGGILAGTKAVLTALGDPPDFSAPQAAAASDGDTGDNSPASIWFFVAFVLFYFIVRIFAGRGRRGGFAPIVLGGLLGSGGGSFGGGGGGFIGGGA